MNVHFAATAPNFLILEYHADDSESAQRCWTSRSQLQDGYVSIPDRPGLGVELTEGILEKYPYRPWRRGRPTKAGRHARLHLVVRPAGLRLRDCYRVCCCR